MFTCFTVGLRRFLKSRLESNIGIALYNSQALTVDVLLIIHCIALSKPVKALGMKTPLQYAATESGAREVENLLGRLEHGVFS